MFGWIIDLVVGALAGTVMGAIVAINVGIWIGVDYEEALSAVFARTSVAGWIVTALLLAGPVVGVWAMRTLRAGMRGDDVSPPPASPTSQVDAH